MATNDEGSSDSSTTHGAKVETEQSATKSDTGTSNTGSDGNKEPNTNPDVKNSDTIIDIKGNTSN